MSKQRELTACNPAKPKAGRGVGDAGTVCISSWST
jgi:hypothetical protein